MPSGIRGWDTGQVGGRKVQGEVFVILWGWEQTRKGALTCSPATEQRMRLGIGSQEQWGRCGPAFSLLVVLGEVVLRSSGVPAGVWSWEKETVGKGRLEGKI